MSLSLDLNRYKKLALEEQDKFVRATLLKVCTSIVYATPVGNPTIWRNKGPAGYIGGTLRGSWQASFGAPVDRPEPGVSDSSGGKTIASISAKIGGYQIGQTFWLSNPQPYATPVEYGWSTQAPAGMLRVSVYKMQAELSRP